MKGSYSVIRRILWIGGIFFFLAAQSLFASGIIKGKVFDKDTKDALPGANILVKGTSAGAASDVYGFYSIPNAPSGEQTIVVSYIGYVSHSVKVTIPENGTVEQDFYLSATAVQGQTVTITAQAQGQLQAINQQLASNKIVIRGLAPKYNPRTIGGVALASTGSSQIGIASQGGTAGNISNDR
ncbi:MAG: carboxypeptidase-like regulatory domain-containing protein, partial [Bacteroidota bacterium]|nr:carboxypeptidase-like regulatory domain-containing protein [Bacteroidota bacterium]